MDLLRQARALYDSGRMHDALEAAQKACELHAKDPEAWWLLGCVARYTGMPAASDLAFRRATELGSHRAAPFRVSEEHFQRLVAEAGRASGTGEKLQVRQLPPLEAVQAGLSPDAMIDRPGDAACVFQVNVENASASEEDLRRRIALLLEQPLD